MKSAAPSVKETGTGPFPSLSRMKALENLHGSAAFARLPEIQDMGLFQTRGPYVGAVLDKERVRYLRHNGPEHILAFAPTRSGKGVGLVLPTLLSWEESALIYDIKGENWALTAGWRRMYAKNICLKYDPGSPEGSVRFNPLGEIRLGTPYEVGDTQTLTSMIVDPEGKGLVDHWARTSHALLVGTILHCLYTARSKGEEATLFSVASTLSDPSKPPDQLFDEMKTATYCNGCPHKVAAAAAQDMLNKADNEKSGVISTATSFLTLYQDPIVAANTSHSEFRISDLMNKDKPVSLYLVVRPSDKDRLKPLIRLVINQILRRLTEHMEFKNGTSVKHYRHRLLLMIDEFPSLGKLAVFQESLAFMAGYGLKAYLIIQDLSQLYDAYGKDEAILSNCHVQIAYAPNKVETAEWLSKKCGVTTIIKKNVSASGKPGILQQRQYSESYQETQRPLLTLDECQRLPGPKKDANGLITEAGDMLIFVAGFPPVYGRQILYFTDSTFIARARLEPPNETDRCDDQIKRNSMVKDAFHRSSHHTADLPAELQNILRRESDAIDANRNLAG